MRNKLIFIACDTANINKVRNIIVQTKNSDLKIIPKFGLQFFYSKKGRQFLEKIKCNFWLDLKVNDIPQTAVSAIDSIKDLRELTYLKVEMQNTGLFMVGGGVPKNFAQDIVVAAESIGHRVPMHQYAIQLTVADVRDGACSSSTLDEASSWGKVDNSNTQMVYGEATSTLPIIANYAYNNVNLENRKRRKLHELFGS